MIYTFYSYKGGVGRSMALANIAEWFFLQQKRVIMIDWDLEAPGLEGYFYQTDQLEQIRSKPGLIDILQEYKQRYLQLNKEIVKTSQEVELTIKKLSNNILGSEIALDQIHNMLNTYALFKEKDIINIINDLKSIPEIGISYIADIISEKVQNEDLLDKISLTIHDELFEDKDNFESIRIYLSLYSLLNKEQVKKIADEIYLLKDQELLNEASLVSLLKPYLSTNGIKNPSAGIFNRKFLESILQEVHTSDAEKNSGLWLLPAGRRDAEYFTKYSEAVQDFSWTEFYLSYDGEHYFDNLRAGLEDFADVILIDSRTGVSEMSGVSTRQLADTIVVFTAPNHQNLAGTHNMIKSFLNPEVAAARGGRSLKVVVVPSRIDSSEIPERNKFEANFYRTIDQVLKNDKSKDFWKLGIPYVPRYLYNEDIAIGTSTDPEVLEQSTKAAELDQAYRNLGNYLLEEKLRNDQYSAEPNSQTTNPFPGLRPFDIDDSPLFYGRSYEINRILDLLTKNNIIIVAGPSGSGKTSLLQAGLMPELKKRHSNSKTVIFYRDGNHFMAESNLLIKESISIIDQAETLLINKTDSQIRNFTDTIKNLVTGTGKNSVIFSIRSEYLQIIIQLLSRYEGIELPVISLSELDEPELKQIIQESARRARLKLEPGLAERIAKDSEKLFMKLPLLQLTLLGLWLNKEFNILTHAAYDKLGQLEGATQLLLNNSLKSISSNDLLAVKSIITRLINIETKSRVSLNLKELTQEEIFKLKPFIDFGLITITSDIKNRSETIQLAHDSIVNNWPVLNEWVIEDQKFLMWRQHLGDFINYWKFMNESASYLLKEKELEEAIAWMLNRPDELSAKEKRFIGLSQEIQINSASQLRIKKYRRFVLETALLLSVALAGFILYYYQITRKEDQFNTALADLDKKIGRDKWDAICTLATFDNTFNNAFIRQKKDSLLQQCIRIQAVFNNTQEIIDNNERRIDTLAAKTFIPANIKTSKHAQQIDTLERKLNNTTMQLAYSNNQKQKAKLRRDSASYISAITRIIKNDTLLSRANLVSQNIETAVKAQVDVVSNKNGAILFQKSSWFKENYFLQFENIKIVLSDFSTSNQTITIRICDMTGPGVCKKPVVFPDPTITLNNAYTFNYEGFEYVLNLDRIGAAGKNPFTPAAFITFLKYKVD